MYLIETLNCKWGELDRTHKVGAVCLSNPLLKPWGWVPTGLGADSENYDSCCIVRLIL